MFELTDAGLLGQLLPFFLVQFAVAIGTQHATWVAGDVEQLLFLHRLAHSQGEHRDVLGTREGGLLLRVLCPAQVQRS